MELDKIYYNQLISMRGLGIFDNKKYVTNIESKIVKVINAQTNIARNIGTFIHNAIRLECESHD
jgi:hypothetical protein